MHALRTTLAHPLFVFGTAGVAFAAWIAFYTTPARPAPEPDAPSSALLGLQSAHDDQDIPELKALKPGLPRLTAEQHLASLARPDVDPVDVSSGRAVVRSHYRMTLARPNVLAEGEFVPGPYVLTVEFDGAAIGHPLTRATLVPAARAD